MANGMSATVDAFFSRASAFEVEAKASQSISISLFEMEVASGELKARWEDVKAAHHEVLMEPVGEGEDMVSEDVRAKVDARLEGCYRIFVSEAARLREGSCMGRQLHSTELPRDDGGQMTVSGGRSRETWEGSSTAGYNQLIGCPQGASGTGSVEEAQPSIPVGTIDQGSSCSRTPVGGRPQVAPRMGSVEEAQPFIPVGPGAHGALRPEECANLGRRRYAIKLAPVDTEPFDGEYTAWPAFRDLFTALFIHHPDLSDVEKMMYLRSKTRGEALELINGLPVMAGSFAQAWNTLCTHYENPRALVTSQLQRLLNLPPVGEGDLAGLKALQRVVNSCVTTFGVLNLSGDDFRNALVTHLCGLKLPAREVDLWEYSLHDQTAIPAWSGMNAFLTQRCGALAAVAQSTGGLASHSVCTRRVYQAEARTCRLCAGQRHKLTLCPRFLRMRIRDRVGVVRRHMLCRNCLGSGHWVVECQEAGTCEHCGYRHHTLLHGMTVQNAAGPDRPAIEPAVEARDRDQNVGRHEGVENESGPSHVVNRLASVQNGVILGTALVVVTGPWGRATVRALIDSGSEATFITRRVQTRLALRTAPLDVQVTGVNSVVSANITRVCSFTIGSCWEESVGMEAEGLVIPSLTGNSPCTVNRSGFDEDLQLADPQFHKGGDVDVLIGGDLFPRVIKEGLRNRVYGSLVAQQTIFGWVLTGPLPTVRVRSTILKGVENGLPLDAQMQRFWEIENIREAKTLSQEEQWCEEFFQRTTVRDSDGRYTVSLPFKGGFGTAFQLGRSRGSAVKQFERNELRLKKNPVLHEEYSRVLNEYLEVGHLRPVAPIQNTTKAGCFYLPHHAVIKPTSETTKVRVVFNASNPSANGVSLNDVLWPGPTLQNDLVTVLSRWRGFKYVFNADIEKMYRQIRLSPGDWRYHRVVHRPTPAAEMQDYELTTVTFGVNAAPYLAIRTLLQLASDEEARYPDAAKVIRDNFYVDDVLGGGHDRESALRVRKELDTVLNSAGFPLRKWAANDEAVLQGVADSDRLKGSFIEWDDAAITKTLGVRWNVSRDVFGFRATCPSTSTRHTKREMLSAIAKLFDPAGWLGPVVVAAKIMMQELWAQQLGWDDDIPEGLEGRWQQFVSGYEDICHIEIPRWVYTGPGIPMQVHGFCDASEKAYAAAVYVRTQQGNGRWTSHLVVAKTRVAPLKSVSIPRLELCGAVLLVDIVSWIVPALGWGDAECRLWTDSTIVLAWLNKPASTWSTFVANRVSRIRRKAEHAKWDHVVSEDNPADLASRGVSAAQLRGESRWWHGPPWLMREESSWPQCKAGVPDQVPEHRAVPVRAARVVESGDWITRFSEFARLLRVVAYMRRFISACRRETRETGGLSVAELRGAKRLAVRVVQRDGFPDECEALRIGGPVASKSNLAGLNPFLDDHSILRVGGRLQESVHMPFGERCPMLLPTTHHFTRLLVGYVHQLSVHGGRQLMLRLIRSEWWIPRAASVVKSVVYQCRVCVVLKARAHSQLMGPLPRERVTLSRPFTATGVDFAGPFDIKTYTGRACKITKGYICLFICCATKAVHLEAASELTTACFLAAFARFTARRGCPRTVMSDNGTNFVGAAKVCTREFQSVVQSLAAAAQQVNSQQELEWRFIPPGAPHMGGLWEAGIKSVKSHLRKSLEVHRLTFEEMGTLLARVEAVLNSRPLTPLSEDPTCLEPLTPGHFLVGGPLLARAEPEPTGPSISMINRWTRVTAIAHEVSMRWKKDYLVSLHARTKWKRPEANISVGDMVVVKNELLPSTEWRLGRVVNAHPGRDGLTRVATVRTQRGDILRPVVKLVRLPTGGWNQPQLAIGKS